MDGSRTETVGRLGDDDADRVTELSAAVAAADGVRPLSEAGRLRVARRRPGATHLLVSDGATLVAYAQVDTGQDGAAAELAVAPTARRRGHGTALVREVAAAFPDAGLRFWAHGDLPAARSLATRLGFTRVRELWLMERPVDDDHPLPELRLPAGVRLRAFVPGRDEEAWLAVNARAFASHPEQGRTTRTDLDVREDEAWFDPAGLLLAERADATVAGFHWTKVEPADPATGEVYVIGVDPAAQGGGLGTALLLAGLHHLAGRGVTRIVLYVEGDSPAVRLYEKLGFEHRSTDVQYAGPA